MLHRSVVALTAALCVVALGLQISPASAAKRIRVANGAGMTLFNVIGGSARTDQLSVTLRGPQSLTLSSPAPAGVKFVWSCEHVGQWTWGASVTDRAGNNIGSGAGQFVVPGPCQAENPVPSLRSAAEEYAGATIRPADFVLDFGCVAATPVDSTGRAARWKCSMKWPSPTGRRACGAPYMIRYVSTIRYGRETSKSWKHKRLGPVKCRAAPRGKKSRLLIPTALQVARKIAVIDLSEFSDFPRYTGLGGPTCRRRSRLRVDCTYTVYERLTSEPDAPRNPKSCDRIVHVRLEEGSVRPTGTRESLGCRVR